MVGLTIGGKGRVFQLKALPKAWLMSWIMLALSGLLLLGVGQLWHFMVFESPKYLESWGVFQSSGVFLAHAFPMVETNGMRFEWKLEQQLILANMVSVMYMRFGRTTTDILEEGQPKKDEDEKDKYGRKKKKKGFTFQRS